MVNYLKLLLAVLIFALFTLGLFASYHFYFSLSLESDNQKKSEPPLGLQDPFLLGQYYFNHGDQADGTYDLKKARDYFELAVTESPTANLLLWHQLGRIDFLEGKFDDAINKFNRQIEYFKDELPNVYYMLGLTYGYKARQSGAVTDWQKAEENFRKYLAYDPLSPWARVDLSWIYFAQGKFEEMKPILEVGLAYEPQNPWLLNMYGLSLLNTENVEMADQYFRSALLEAEKLSIENWGSSYPGNNPDIWGQGLEEFRALIKKNIDLAVEPVSN